MSKQQLLEPTPEDLRCLAHQLADLPALLQTETSLAPIARLLVGPSAEAIPVHTHILLARCPYIKALVSSNMKESLQGSTSFQLPELTVVGVEQVVQYMYSGCFSVSSATVVEVMEAAKYLLMTGVEQRCADYIAQHLDIASAADLLDTAVAMQSIPMQQVVLGYVCTHAQDIFKAIALKRSFDHIDPQILLLLLQQDDLELNEDELFYFVRMWLEAHPQLPTATAAQLLENVSYAAMSSKALTRVAQQPPAGVDPKWVQEALACKDDALLLSEVAPERRRRVPTPVIMLYGRGWFKSRHALELVLHEGAKKDGCVLDLQAASSYATVSERRGLFDASKQFHVEAWVCPCYLSQRDPCFGPILSKHSTGAGWEVRMGRDGIQMMVTLRKRQQTWHEVVACNQDVQLGKWIHIAGGFDGQRVTLHVDGQPYYSRQPSWNNYNLVQDPCDAVPVEDNLVPFAIGKNCHWPDRKLVGKVTGVRVVRDKVVSPGEFLKLVI